MRGGGIQCARHSIDACIAPVRRAVTSTQIAKATETERAEARGRSADRRQKLRLELGESEGISALLENSLLGAEGDSPTNPDDCCPGMRQALCACSLQPASCRGGAYLQLKQAGFFTAKASKNVSDYPYHCTFSREYTSSRCDWGAEGGQGLLVQAGSRAW